MSVVELLLKVICWVQKRSHQPIFAGISRISENDAFATTTFELIPDVGTFENEAVVARSWPFAEYVRKHALGLHGITRHGLYIVITNVV